MNPDDLVMIQKYITFIESGKLTKGVSLFNPNEETEQYELKYKGLHSFSGCDIEYYTYKSANEERDISITKDSFNGMKVIERHCDCDKFKKHNMCKHVKSFK